MAYAAENPAASPAAYANWGQRVGGYLIDYVPIFVLELIGIISRNFFPRIWYNSGSGDGKGTNTEKFCLPRDPIGFFRGFGSASAWHFRLPVPFEGGT